MERTSESTGVAYEAQSLLNAPDTPLLILRLEGGEDVRRRLMALGLHKGDVLRLETRAPFRGPLLVLNETSGCRVALGRGVARHIIVRAACGIS